MHAQFAVHMLTEEGKQKAAEIAQAFDDCLTRLEEGKQKAAEIAQAFDDCLTRLEKVCPEGRHLALVRTKMEEACFFAKKAMAEQNSIPAT